MKVWLNELKEGDTFYFPSTILCSVLKCEHLGDAHNMNYRMSRIKYKVLEGYPQSIGEIFKDTQELFVNQYVYDNYESAYAELIKKLTKELEKTETSILDHKNSINNLEVRADELRKALNIKYDK